MNILAIETTTATASFAIYNGNHIYHCAHTGSRKHSKVILASIEKLLTRSKLTIADIDHFVVGVGPGSFIGSRLGYSIAQALCVEDSTKLIGLSSLQIIAQASALMHNLSSVLVAQDARKSELYCAMYAKKSDVMQPISDEELIHPRALSNLINTDVHYAVGSGWKVYEDQIPKMLIDQIQYIHLDYELLADAAIDIVRTSKDNHQQLKPMQLGYLRNNIATLPHKKNA